MLDPTKKIAKEGGRSISPGLARSAPGQCGLLSTPTPEGSLKKPQPVILQDPGEARQAGRRQGQGAAQKRTAGSRRVVSPAILVGRNRDVSLTVADRPDPALSDSLYTNQRSHGNGPQMLQSSRPYQDLSPRDLRQGGALRSQGGRRRQPVQSPGKGRFLIEGSWTRLGSCLQTTAKTNGHNGGAKCHGPAPSRS